MKHDNLRQLSFYSNFYLQNTSEMRAENVFPYLRNPNPPQIQPQLLTVKSVNEMSVHGGTMKKAAKSLFSIMHTTPNTVFGK